jgi:transposase
MYIREVKKQRSKDSKTFYQYTLAQTLRLEGKVKQNAILYLGSDSLLADKDNRRVVLEILRAKIFNQKDLFPMNAPKPLIDLALSYFEKYCLKYGQDSTGAASIPPAPDKAEFHRIDIEGLEVEEVHTFGGEHLCKQVLDKLELKECLSALGLSSKQTGRALISIAARALFTASEHKTAQILEINSALRPCFNYDESINHRELYATSDILYTHKDKIDAFLYQRISTLFHLQDRLVIFDISNTYFETRKSASKLAKHGRSKEKRSDCPLVVFTGVINAEGFIRHSRIYEGNKADTATLADMLADLQQHSATHSKQTVVLDAGIASEENLALIREKGYHYVCVSRHRLNDYPFDGEEKRVVALTDRGKSSVSLKTFRPEGYEDTWLYVQSQAKQRKEQSMDAKLKGRLEEELDNIEAALHKKGGTKRIEKVWERIGRAKERHSHVSSQYQINVAGKDGKALSIEWKKKEQTKSKADKAEGVYFIRTSYTDSSEEELWQVYNTIREVEATFRCLKSDLQIRPVYHQNDERIEAHIYLTILAYQLVNTIRCMLKEKGLHYDWKNIVRIMNTQTIQTLVLPTDKKTIHLRKPAKPIKEARDIYSATGCSQTQKPIKKYVVYH